MDSRLILVVIISSPDLLLGPLPVPTTPLGTSLFTGTAGWSRLVLHLPVQPGNDTGSNVLIAIEVSLLPGLLSGQS